MSPPCKKRLADHLRRHARTLRNIACGFGRAGDADDIIQILYARWWQRMGREADWSPPEESAALFVCVKRVVLDEIAKDKRRTARAEASRLEAPPRRGATADEALHAIQRLEWILSQMPASLREAMQATLAAGRARDAAVAAELGITHAAFTARLHKARRAAEELAAYYDVLGPQEADLVAALRFGGKSQTELAREGSLLLHELRDRLHDAVERLHEHGVELTLRIPAPTNRGARTA